MGRAFFFSPQKLFFFPLQAKSFFFFPLQSFYFFPKAFYFAPQAFYFAPKLCFCSPKAFHPDPTSSARVYESKCPRCFPPSPRCLLPESRRDDCVRRIQGEENRSFKHNWMTSFCYTVFVPVLVTEPFDFHTTSVFPRSSICVPVLAPAFFL